MADPRQLLHLVESAEDFASALRKLRDEVPRDAQRDVTDITGAIGELYRLSNILRQLTDALDDPQYRYRIHRIQLDARLVCRSVHRTLDTAHDMVGCASDTTQWMVWDDLSHRMRDVERVSLLIRLRWYYNFIQGLLQQLDGGSIDDQQLRIKSNLQGLLEQQVEDDFRPAVVSYRHIEPPSSPVRPRIMPTSQGPRPRRLPSDSSDPSRYNGQLPPVPTAPPQSPPFTGSSTNTLVSASDDSPSWRTSYSSFDNIPDHWLLYVFDGQTGRSRYRGNGQLNVPTQCMGHQQADAKVILDEDEFVPLVNIRFADNDSVATFYVRPHDKRARLLLTTLDSRGRETYYCIPLTRLRAFRDGSILKLCMASSHNHELFRTWASLKFVYHERMVLFYSAFVASKRQDLFGLPKALIEDFRDMQEDLKFSGVIRDGRMLHQLRLFEDRGSRVVRLEASPYEGDREDVPIWTAFLTKYRDRQDPIFNLECNGVVSMIVCKPQPYLFLSDYGLPMMSTGDFALQFTTSNDAAHLINVWTSLCNSGR